MDPSHPESNLGGQYYIYGPHPSQPQHFAPSSYPQSTHFPPQILLDGRMISPTLPKTAGGMRDDPPIVSPTSKQVFYYANRYNSHISSKQSLLWTQTRNLNGQMDLNSAKSFIIRNLKIGPSPAGLGIRMGTLIGREVFIRGGERLRSASATVFCNAQAAQRFTVLKREHWKLKPSLRRVVHVVKLLNG